MRSHISILIPVFLAVLVVASCTSDPTSVPAHQEQPAIEEGEPLARGAFFTGRDSFGVAFKANVKEVTFNQSTGGFDVTGWGNATHLGKIDVAGKLQFDTGRDSLFGSLTFNGKGRQVVQGDYHIDVISPSPDIQVTSVSATHKLDGWVEITDHAVSATKAEDDIGWASLTGTIDMEKKTISYRLDGWLLHFVKETDGE